MPQISSPHLLTTFLGGPTGSWQVVNTDAILGEELEAVDAIEILTTPHDKISDTGWALAGIGSNLRYTAADERTNLNRVSEKLGRPSATLAALIPITKSEKWWSLAQDERLRIYRRSEHYKIGMDALPQIARKLYHSRDLGQPFDFLTWFEFAPQDANLFDQLLVRLRASEEWQYVEREVDIRLIWTGIGKENTDSLA